MSTRTAIAPSRRIAALVLATAALSGAAAVSMGSSVVPSHATHAVAMPPNDPTCHQRFNGYLGQSGGVGDPVGYEYVNVGSPNC